MEFVYPRVREYCRERYGIEFQVDVVIRQLCRAQCQWKGGGHALGSARRDDERAHDNRALHEGARLLPEALNRYRNGKG